MQAQVRQDITTVKKERDEVKKDEREAQIAPGE